MIEEIKKTVEIKGIMTIREKANKRNTIIKKENMTLDLMK